MILQNELCNVKIAIDETFTVESTDNMPYDLVLNPYQKRHNDLYKVFVSLMFISHVSVTSILPS